MSSIKEKYIFERKKLFFVAMYRSEKVDNKRKIVYLNTTCTTCTCAVSIRTFLRTSRRRSSTTRRRTTSARREVGPGAGSGDLSDPRPTADKEGILSAMGGPMRRHGASSSPRDGDRALPGESPGGAGTTARRVECRPWRSLDECCQKCHWKDPGVHRMQ